MGYEKCLFVDRYFEKHITNLNRARTMNAGTAIALGLGALMETLKIGFVVQSYEIFLLNRKSCNEKERAEYQRRKIGERISFLL